ncbi:uncharacterized protein C8Q71DRAFT_861545 [Rhodofomes roseus]|uniref:Uncharacterized protein n=1 Tax=Rhodofomes roseus TaxID=34475 RepID=A0ABQ8K484_9APHY|nr:uncharacterized protein C8Q71DRAFT_861545 [Rhodofomes roseus]KAH9831511.1 hypothetical protein C8Q71DRAFT_861545 [Rhodofomes roseus]
MPVDEGKHRPDLVSQDCYMTVNCVDDARLRGLRVLLNTATSVSRLRQSFVQAINTGLLGNESVIEAPKDSRPILETYHVPGWVADPRSRIQVVYEFEGVHGQSVLNFFRSMYVSLHKATDGDDFVRMAAQWPENYEADMRDYLIEGLTEVDKRNERTNIDLDLQHRLRRVKRYKTIVGYGERARHVLENY